MAQYRYDTEQETLIKEVNGKKECLGCGKIVVKPVFKKASKKPSPITSTPKPPTLTASSKPSTPKSKNLKRCAKL